MASKDKGFMGDDERATIGADRHKANVPIAIDSEDTPPPIAVDPAMQSLIDRFWPLRKLDEQIASERKRDQDRVISLATDVAVLKSRVDDARAHTPNARIEQIAEKVDEVNDRVDELESELKTTRQHIWGDSQRKPDEPSVAAQARSGRRLLGWVLAAVLTLGGAGAAGVLVAVRRGADAEGEQRAWRATVNEQIQLLLRVVLRIDAPPILLTPPKGN